MTLLFYGDILKELLSIIIFRRNFITNKIKFLSSTTINKIAAGEVIERPASVMKELIENAIDAKADEINITLECSGKNLILIADNGIGMNAEELQIAIERHTTSKLNEDDLLDIHSFGFRGEALPSIGAISKMSITSRTKDTDLAYKIEVIGGIVGKITPSVNNIGTKIEIRDLFFAVPARLKFLKSERTELSACKTILEKIALAHPHVSFSLIHEGKTLLNLKKRISDDFIQSIKARIIDILGQDFIDNSIVINEQYEDLTIKGYISIPTYNRATSEDQFFFVNYRPIKDKILSVAIKLAYQDYLARDRYPVVILFIGLNPQNVDVNTHPAKTEVRFNNPNFIKKSLINAIIESLSNNSHKTSTTLASTTLGYFNLGNTAKEYSEPKNRQNNINSEYYLAESNKPFNYLKESLNQTTIDNVANKTQYVNRDLNVQHELIKGLSPQVRTHEPVTEIINKEDDKNYGDFFLGAAHTQVNDTYIISQTTNSLIIIDQHAAHERLVYEKIKQQFLKQPITKQRLLIPEILELPDSKRASLLIEQQQQLSNLGLTLEAFGDKSIIVSEIPAIINDVNIKQLILDIADHLLAYGENIALIELIEHITETYACHHSIRSGKKLNIEEMNELLRAMEKTPFSGQCNHGRPTYIELKLSDIEKLFGRK